MVEESSERLFGSPLQRRPNLLGGGKSLSQELHILTVDAHIKSNVHCKQKDDHVQEETEEHVDDDQVDEDWIWKKSPAKKSMTPIRYNRRGRPTLSTIGRSLSCPSSPCTTTPPLTTLTQNRVCYGQAQGIPVRILTDCGLHWLFNGFKFDLQDIAVIFDYDKVLTNEPVTTHHESGELLTNVRGGRVSVELLRRLHEAGVPLFIATARRTQQYLQDMVDNLVEKAELGYTQYFSRPTDGYGDAMAFRQAGEQVQVELIQNEQLGFTFRRVKGTSIFSAGYEKGKLVAHIASRELSGSRRKIVFVDDNVFNAYFVLQEAPQYLHETFPSRDIEIISSWWDPSEEQNKGLMRVCHDSDFSYIKEYQECLSAFGVSEAERIRTAGKLFAKALLRGEDNNSHGL